MTINSNSVLPTIRFEYDRDGQVVVAVQGDGEVYRGAFDVAKVEQAVRRMGLSQRDRASLYLAAADRCQDEDVVDALMALAQRHAQRANSIDDMRQQFDIPLTPIGDAKVYVNTPYGEGRNDGTEDVPPKAVETFVPRLPITITKEIREQMVGALEGCFVPYNRGELVLRALGLVSGEMTNYVNWQQGLLQLAALTLFALGRATFTLDEEQAVGGVSLPAGCYGNGTPIVAVRGGGERHWQMVTALFRDARGTAINSGSLRSTATRVERTDGKVFSNIIYLFRPLIFDTNNRPRQNNLFYGRGGAGMDGAEGVSPCGG